MKGEGGGVRRRSTGDDEDSCSLSTGFARGPHACSSSSSSFTSWGEAAADDDDAAAAGDDAGDDTAAAVVASEDVAAAVDDDVEAAAASLSNIWATLALSSLAEADPSNSHVTAKG